MENKDTKTPLTEKYRPRNLKELICHTDIIRLLVIRLFGCVCVYMCARL